MSEGNAGGGRTALVVAHTGRKDSLASAREVVFRLIEAGLPVSAAPGANAAVTALTLSGLPPHPFLFAGFPPPRSAARRSSFAILRAAERAGLSATLIWHEAPHRLAEALADLHAVFGDRDAAVARELTKRFEEVRRGTLADLATHYQQQQARGEITVLVGPPPDEAAGQDELDIQLNAALATHSVKDAATLVAGAVGLPRRTVYARAMELAGKGSPSPIRGSKNKEQGPPKG